MIYEYENGLGERREIVASMKNPPPEEIYLDGNGNWHPRNKATEREHAMTSPHNQQSVRGFYRRVYTVPQIGRIDNGGGVNHEFQRAEGKLPVSCTLPLADGGKIVTRFGKKVREVAPGLYANMKGQRIVDSKSSADRHAAACGYEREK